MTSTGRESIHNEMVQVKLEHQDLSNSKKENEKGRLGKLVKINTILFCLLLSFN